VFAPCGGDPGKRDQLGTSPNVYPWTGKKKRGETARIKSPNKKGQEKSNPEKRKTHGGGRGKENEKDKKISRWKRQRKSEGKVGRGGKVKIAEKRRESRPSRGKRKVLPFWRP